MFFFRGPASDRQAPSKWLPKLNLPVYFASQCTPTKLAADASSDLEWLRSKVLGVTSTHVYGRAIQNSVFGSDQDLLARLPGVKVTLSGGDTLRETITSSEGEYSFADLPSGPYTLHAERAPWWPPKPISIDLASGGCVVEILQFRSDGSIEGSVIDADGLAAPHAEVLLYAVREGLVSHKAIKRITTDGKGHFLFRNVAAGTFELRTGDTVLRIELSVHETVRHLTLRPTKAAP
jgi:hypothetical protein